jgi:hypothetical protein
MLGAQRVSVSGPVSSRMNWKVHATLPFKRVFMTTRFLTIAIALSLLAAAAGKFLTYTPESSKVGAQLLTYGLELGQLLALVLLVSSGTIIGTGYFRIILLLFGVALVGGLFKIMHYPGADALLRTPLVGIALTYAVRFARKPHLGQLDILKLLLVLISCGSAMLLSLHLVSREARYVAPCLLWLSVLDFQYLENKKRVIGK